MNNQNYESISAESYEIDFVKISMLLWANKFKVIIIISSVILASIIYSIGLPNTYQSKTVLAPSSSSNSNISRLASQYQGVASLAGFSIPNSGEIDKVAMSIEVLKSLNFFKEFLSKNDLYMELLATEGWDSTTDQLLVDPSIYDVKSKKWIDNSRFSIDGMPSIQSAHKNFLDNLIIEIEPNNGFVTLYFEHYSPNVSKKVLDLLVLDINHRSKEEDVSVAKNSINYLKEEITKTNVSSIIIAINSIIEKQLEIITFANANPEYLLKTLAPPSAPEKKNSPNRALIVIFSSILGVLLSISYIFFLEIFNRNKH